MIKWIEAKKTRPEDNQSCFITTERGLYSQPIIGPIFYKKDVDVFLDLFDTPEAGTSFGIKDHDLFWCDEKEINLPNEEK